MGEMSDKMIDVAKETASDALESGKRIAHDAADDAKGQGHELASTLQERTHETWPARRPAGSTRLSLGPAGPETTPVPRRLFTHTRRHQWFTAGIE